MKDFVRWVMYGAVFAVPFVLLLVSSTMFFPYITGKNFAFRILVEIAFASWLLLALIDQAYRPKLSYILYSVLGLVSVMFVANIFGEYAPKSFWSNYERMEGWVTLLHFSMYFVVLSTALHSERLWNRFFNTALVAAVLMSLFALAQVFGAYEISQGGNWRVDGRLGNSTYLGVYMLFHIFIAAWLLLGTKLKGLRWTYGGLIALFVFILSQTGTRGAMYGLIGGLVLAFLYLALMAPRGAMIRKWALGGFLAVVMLVGGVYLARDTDFVQNSPALNRFASTTLSEGNIRFIVWQMAWKGVKEHPILGWGQENFSYVFNKYYDPALYGAEPWYDRTHNIFLDWLIAGGMLGLAAYLLVLLSALWYSVITPLTARFVKETKRNSRGAFTVYEQALILGLLAAYMFHNLFVFDNLGSWIFYAVVLALIHSKVGMVWKDVVDFKLSIDTWHKVAVPTTAFVVLLIIYFTNVPSMLAAKDIINAYRVSSPTERLEKLRQASDRGGFADQEIFEQYTQISTQILLSANLDEEVKENLIASFEQMRAEMLKRKPDDARLYIISANFYRAINDLNKSMADLNKAEELSPLKQAIKEEQGMIYMLAGREEEAILRFKTAYEMDMRSDKTRVRLAAAYIFADQPDDFRRLVGEEILEENEGLNQAYITEPLLVQIAYQKKDYAVLESIFNKRVEYMPSDKSQWINLTALHFEQGELQEAEAVVLRAMAAIPEFKEEGEGLLAEIRAAR